MATSTITPTFYKQGNSTLDSGTNVMTCLRYGNSGASSTCDIGGSGSGSNYRNGVYIRFGGLPNVNVKSASIKITFKKNSDSYWTEPMTLTFKPTKAISSSTTGTNRPSTIGSTSATVDVPGSPTSVSKTITAVINAAITDGSKTISIWTTAENNRKGVSSIVLTYTTYDNITITYYGNGATGVGSNSSASGTTTSSLTSTIKYGSHTDVNLYNVGSLFVRKGYHRVSSDKAWRVGSATATTYMSDASVDFSSYFANGTTSLKLYANWTPNTFSIVYNSNGGTQESGNTYTMPYTHSFSYGTTYENGLINTTTFGLSKSYYHFNDGVEWNTEPDGSGTSFNHDTAYDTTAKVVALASKFGIDLETTTGEEGNVYANWKPNVLTVNYYGNGATGVGSTSGASGTTVSNLTSTITYGSSHSAYNIYNVASLFTKTGYHRLSEAKAWRVGSATATTYMSEASANFTPYLTTHGDTLNLYANWTKNVLTITYMRNTNSSDTTSTTESFTYSGNDSAGNFGNTTTDGWKTAKTGYHPTEWTQNQDGSGTSWDLANEVTDARINSNYASGLTVYLQWALNTYKIAYDANGGTGSMSTTSATYNTAATLRTNSFSRVGYTFQGWSLSKTATTATYKDKASVTNLTSEHDKTVTLYAVWKINTLKLTYDANGGIQGTDTSHTLPYTATYNYGTTYDMYNVVAGFDLSKAGYHINASTAWNTKSDGSGVSYNPNVDILAQDIASQAGKDLGAGSVEFTIYANWVVNTLSIIYNANGGTQGGNESYTLPFTRAGNYGEDYNSGYGLLDIETFDLSKTGYEIIEGEEWNTAIDGSGRTISQTTTYTTEDLADALGTSIISSNQTINLYPKWIAKTFIITFDPNEGSIDTTSKTVTYDSTYGALPVPTRENYDFVGWYTEKEGGTLVTSSSTVLITENKTLYAHWSKDVYQIIYDSNGLEVDLSEYSMSLPYGENKEITLLNPLQDMLFRFGYIPQTNQEWNTASDGSGTSLSYLSSVNSSTLEEYAQENGNELTLYLNWRPAGKMAYFTSTNKAVFIHPRVLVEEAWKRAMVYICIGLDESGNSIWKPTIEPFATGLQRYQIIYPNIYPAGDNLNIYTNATIDEFYPAL